MSGRWLYIGLLLILLALFPHWWLFYLLILVWQWHTHKLTKGLCIGLLMAGVYFHLPINNEIPTVHQGVVKELRNGYLIVEFDHQKTIVYTDELYPINTVIEVSGEFESLKSKGALYAFSFDEWCARRGISAVISAQQIKEIKPSSSLQRFFLERILSMDDEKVRTWCLSVFYGVREQDVFYLVASSAMHLSFFVRLLDKHMKQGSGFICLFLYALLINFNFSISRLLIFQAVRLIGESWGRKDRLGASICLTLVLFPYAVYELSFLLPVCFSLLSLFACHRLPKLLAPYCVLMPIQLLNFCEFDLISPLLFPFFRSWYALNFLIAFVTVLSGVDWLTKGILFGNQLMTSLRSFTFTWWGKPHLIMIMLYLWALVLYLHRKNQRTISCLALSMGLMLFSPWLDPFTEVTFIDVGQGDSILITLPFHQGAVMIDAAGSLYTNIPERKIVPVLKAKGYQQVDLLILTHEDYDHSGGLAELQELMEIKQIVDDRQNVSDYKQLQLISLLDDVQGKDENDSSILILSRIGGLDYLFMGDASTEVEKLLIERYPRLRCDVLKVGHHGSDTSTSAMFIQTVMPRLAMISAGLNNRYGHPHQSVLDTLESYHVNVLRTDLQGDLAIRSWLGFNWLISGNHEISWIASR